MVLQNWVRETFYHATSDSFLVSLSNGELLNIGKDGSLIRKTSPTKEGITAFGLSASGKLLVGTTDGEVGWLSSTFDRFEKIADCGRNQVYEIDIASDESSFLVAANQKAFEFDTSGKLKTKSLEVGEGFSLSRPIGVEPVRSS